MDDEYPYAVLVEGEWASVQAKAIKNKLQIYFSKKKSGGGDCKVEIADDDSARATVYFKCDEGDYSVLNCLFLWNYLLSTDIAMISLRLPYILSVCEWADS